LLGVTNRSGIASSTSVYFDGTPNCEATSAVTRVLAAKSFSIDMMVKPDASAVMITFIDHGVPYDPLAKEDPDITLSSEDRTIGGLGIFLVKKNMDDVKYEYVKGSNILTLVKKLRVDNR
jgi:anti-sigma regulatory factor (Ser/Thr protein kinase)